MFIYFKEVKWKKKWIKMFLKNSDSMENKLLLSNLVFVCVSVVYGGREVFIL